MTARNIATWYVRHPELLNDSDGEADDEGDNVDDDVEYEPIVDERSGEPPFIPPSQRDDAPLAGILQNPELDKIDPRCDYY
ncbi:unnamed protein product [Anisakis simplex]|uniref:Transposase n=1 Tax=Anisakis simplex TaxID=6269 RepID=A0A0M3JNY2_ANISI|nr:unnamed protein product [Anisakis simplex]